MENVKVNITESEDDTVTSEEEKNEQNTDVENIYTKTIGKMTYVVQIHFKEEGETFSEKLKRVLKSTGI